MAGLPLGWEEVGSKRTKLVVFTVNDPEDTIGEFKSSFQPSEEYRVLARGTSPTVIVMYPTAGMLSSTYTPLFLWALYWVRLASNVSSLLRQKQSSPYSYIDLSALWSGLCCLVFQ